MPKTPAIAPLPIITSTLAGPLIFRKVDNRLTLSNYYREHIATAYPIMPSTLVSFVLFEEFTHHSTLEVGDKHRALSCLHHAFQHSLQPFPAIAPTPVDSKTFL